MYIYLPHKKLYTKLTYHDHFDKNVEQLDLSSTSLEKYSNIFCPNIHMCIYIYILGCLLLLVRKEKKISMLVVFVALTGAFKVIANNFFFDTIL